MDFYEFQSAVAVFVPIVISIGGAGYSWWASRKKAAAKEIETLERAIGAKADTAEVKAVRTDLEKIDDEVDLVKERVSTLEHTIKQLPDKESIYQLGLAIEQLNTKIASLSASAEATERTARRVEQFLIDRSDKARGN